MHEGLGAPDRAGAPWDEEVGFSKNWSSIWIRELPDGTEEHKLRGGFRVAPVICLFNGEGIPLSIPPRFVRLQEVYDRLERFRPFNSFEDAYQSLVSILVAVEDEFTGIPNQPSNHEWDGRLYPPQPDHWRKVPGYPNVTRMRSKGHFTFIAMNGALEIQVANTGVVMLSKAGADGRKVWDDE